MLFQTHSQKWINRISENKTAGNSNIDYGIDLRSMKYLSLHAGQDVLNDFEDYQKFERYKNSFAVSSFFSILSRTDIYFEKLIPRKDAEIPLL